MNETTDPRPPQRIKRVYVVRWTRRTRPAEARHRYFARRHAAEAFAARQAARGRDPVVYVTAAEWQRLDWRGPGRRSAR